MNISMKTGKTNMKSVGRKKWHEIWTFHKFYPQFLLFVPSMKSVIRPC